MWLDAAYSTGIRAGTNAQQVNIYNTYTSSTNYERAELNWRANSNVFTIQTTKGSGGGSLRNIALEPSGGSVGIGTTSPQATLDVNGYMRLAANASQPAACAAGNDGAVALTHVYTICVCNGGATSWVKASDGSTACGW
jgi:hypothetical protein